MVSREINNLLTSRKAKRGELPIGVSLQKSTNKYLSYVRNNKGVKEYLGVFDRPEWAANSYLVAKAAIVRQAAYKEKSPVKEALLRVADEIEDGHYFDVNEV